jgi:hypothetical protein
MPLGFDIKKIARGTALITDMVQTLMAIIASSDMLIVG